MHRLLLIAVACACSSAFAAAKENVVDFKVVPGKAQTISVPLDTPPIAGSTCTFEYSSTGATTEMWSARVSGNPRSGEIECEIGRKGGAETYLLFNKFKTTLGTNEILEAIVHDNDGELDEEHWDSDGECVRNANDWSGSIRRVHVKSMITS